MAFTHALRACPSTPRWARRAPMKRHYRTSEGKTVVDLTLNPAYTIELSLQVPVLGYEGTGPRTKTHFLSCFAICSVRTQQCICCKSLLSLLDKFSPLYSSPENEKWQTANESPTSFHAVRGTHVMSFGFMCSWSALGLPANPDPPSSSSGTWRYSRRRLSGRRRARIISRFRWYLSIA